MAIDNIEYLEKFLDYFHFIYPDLSDAFYYATADTERIMLDGLGENNNKALVEVYDKFGVSGIRAYVEKMGIEHKGAPLKELQNAEYFRAKEFLSNWNYDNE